jgi:hypothetical protein
MTDTISVDEYRKLARAAEREPRAKRDFADWLGRVSPVPIFTEVVFHPTRKWRADYFVESAGIIVEYDGMNGRAHASVNGMLRDSAKGNEAQVMGYLFLRVNARSIADGSAYDVVRRAFALRGYELQEP